MSHIDYFMCESACRSFFYTNLSKSASASAYIKYCQDGWITQYIKLTIRYLLLFCKSSWLVPFFKTCSCCSEGCEARICNRTLLRLKHAFLKINLADADCSIIVELDLADFNPNENSKWLYRIPSYNQSSLSHNGNHFHSSASEILFTFETCHC